MNIPEITTTFKIQLHQHISTSNYKIAIESYWGRFADVHYFQTQITTDTNQTPQLGLLRFGKTDGALQKELELRQHLANHRMIAPLLETNIVEHICISLQPNTTDIPIPEENHEIDFNLNQLEDELSELEQLFSDINLEETSEYLEEEHYDQHIQDIEIDHGILSLSYLPEPETSLATWLETEKELSSILPVIIQFCQLINYISQHGWSLVQINPKAIAITKPIQLYDLVGAFKIAEIPANAMIGTYCPPELALGRPVDEQMSSYAIGVLLYEAIHNQQPRVSENVPPRNQTNPRDLPNTHSLPRPQRRSPLRLPTTQPISRNPAIAQPDRDSLASSQQIYIRTLHESLAKRGYLRCPSTVHWRTIGNTNVRNYCRWHGWYGKR